MRKRNISFLFDHVMWYIVYLLPLLIMLIFNVGSIADTFTHIGINLAQNNPIYVAILDIFGANGVVPLFMDDGAIMYVAYFATCVIVHLCVDFLLFIPRLAHKWVDMFNEGVQK